MAGKAVAEREASQVPALRPTPALEIEASDIALPRIYIGQYMSKAVQDQIVKPGSIYSATGQDDPDPQVLWNQGDDVDSAPVFHVLSLRKGKSIQDNGELVLFDYDDPNAPPEAWVTYNYAVAIPAIEEDVPFKLLLTRTGTPAARDINFVLKKSRRAAWESAFSLTAAPRENAKGKFFVARARQVDAAENDVKVAEALAVMVAAAPIEAQATEQPAI